MSHMFGKIQRVLQHRADMTLASRYGDCARQFLYPFVADAGTNRYVVPDEDAMAQVFAILHRNMRQKAVCRVAVTVTAMDLPRKGRFRVWACYRKIGATAVVESDVLHYCRETPYGIQTEMSEYSRQCARDLWGHPALRNLSAVS